MKEPAFVSPNVQCPQKPRGRKPKNKDTAVTSKKSAQETSEAAVKASAASILEGEVSKGVGGKSRKRVRQPVLDAVPTPASKKQAAAASKPEVSEPAASRKRKAKESPAPPASSPPSGDVNPAPPPAPSHNRISSPAGASQGAPPPPPDAAPPSQPDDDEKKAKKAKQSRKSAAYHRAVKAAKEKGADEKTAKQAGRDVS